MRNPPKIIAVIPAKGESKRLPGKNLIRLCGKPMLTWTIEAALNSRYITDVIVSTDDDFTADIALLQGAQVIKRPPQMLISDACSMVPGIHALGIRRDDDDTVVVVLHPTEPLRTTDDIDNTIAVFLANEDADIAAAVVQVDYPATVQSYWAGTTSKMVWVTDNNPVVAERTHYSYYCFAVIVLQVDDTIRITKDMDRNSSVWMPKDVVLYGHEVDKSHVVHVDTQEDFDYAEFLMEKRLKWLL